MQFPEQPKDPWIGRRVAAGKYQLLRLIAAGGMGKVYAARHTTLGRDAAIKVLHGSYQHDERMIARFHREAQAASRIHHPNVVEILDFGQEPDGLLYIVMEYLQGEDLEEAIHREGPFAPRRAALLATQMCSAVSAAHASGIIHRDLKPKNIILQLSAQEDGSVEEVVKVLDFGIAKIQDVQAQTIEMAAGTPEFMSPEQCRGEPVDGRTDIYALGVILYAMLTGDVPFTGPNPVSVILRQVNDQAAPPSQLIGKIPPALDAIVLKTLAKTPANRHQNLMELRAELTALIPQLSDTADDPVGIDLNVDDITPPEGINARVAAAAAATAASTNGHDPFDASHQPLLGAPPARPASMRPARKSPVRMLALGGAVGCLAAVVGVVLALSSEEEPGAAGGGQHVEHGAGAPDIQPAGSAPTRVNAQDEGELDPPDRDAQEVNGRADEEDELAEAESDEPGASPSRRAQLRAAALARRRAAARNARAERRAAAARQEERMERAAAAEPEPEPQPEPEPVAQPEPPPREQAPAAETQPARTVARTPEPPRPPPPAVPSRVSARVTGLSSQGSLPTSVVSRAIERVSGRFQGCYLDAARRARRGGADRVQVRFEIDEMGRARRVSVGGGSLPGLSRCVGSAVQQVVSRRRPDIGTVQASFAVVFQP